MAGPVARLPRLLLRPLALVLLLTLCAQAPAVEFRQVTSAGKTFVVCRVDVRKEKLQLFLRDDSGATLKTFAAVERLVTARQQRLLFAMNAGMYHPDYAPVGLFVSDGKQVAPLNSNDGEGNFFLKPNGVFFLTAAGARVLETSEMAAVKESLHLATQSGPLLVREGRIHPKFKPDSTFRLIRNGVGVPDPGSALFVISSDPVNLYEFAVFFRDALHCPDALYFDGTVSSLHAPPLHRSDKKIDLGPIIGVVGLPEP